MLRHSGIVFVFLSQAIACSVDANPSLSIPDGLERAGSSIAFDGTTLVAGAPEGVGTAIVYQEGPSGWNVTQLLQPLETPPAGESTEFGVAADMDGSTLIISAGFEFPGQSLNGGGVWVFELTGGTWSELQRFQPNSLTGSGFGESISISGDWIAVGEPLFPNDDPDLGYIGRVHLFRREYGTWVADQIIDSDGLSQFGIGVSIDGERLAVASGTSTRLYERQDGSWQQVADAIPPGDQSDWLRSSVALFGDRLVVGAHSISAQHFGRAYVFVRDVVTGSWPLMATFQAFDNPDPPPPGGPRAFGLDVDTDGSRVIVGSVGASSPAFEGPMKGVAYVFRSVEGQWEHSVKLLDEDETPLAGFGNDVRLAGNCAALGAPKRTVDDIQIGGVFVFCPLPGGNGGVSGG